MKIEPDKFYSALQAQKLAKLKTRQYVAKYINEGKLLAIQTGAGGAHIRYAIKGEWLSDFINRYKGGKVAGKQYTKEEQRALLTKALNKLK